MVIMIIDWAIKTEPLFKTKFQDYIIRIFKWISCTRICSIYFRQIKSNQKDSKLRLKKKREKEIERERKKNKKIADPNIWCNDTIDKSNEMSSKPTSNGASIICILSTMNDRYRWNEKRMECPCYPIGSWLATGCPQCSFGNVRFRRQIHLRPTFAPISQCYSSRSSR